MLLLACIARPLAINWINLIAVTAGLELIYILTCFQIGVFGATEKEAFFWLWQKIAKFKIN